MEPPSMDIVYQAISALYDNPNAYEKEKASIWLGDVQKSIHSWKIADELLQHKKDIQSCYFAAQTMRSKVQHNLSELSKESLLSLRDSLITHLNGVSPDTSSPILTQLSLALADLALQMPMWQNCVTDLINSFSNNNAFALLEILTVLPQEIDSTNLKLGENRREEIKAELRSNSHVVSSFLIESISNTQNQHVALKIVKCFTSWVQVRAISLEEVPQNAVVGFCLQVLKNHYSINLLHEAASDCICALLHCLEKNNNDVNVEKLLFDSVIGLEESYHMAVANEDEEKTVNYARLFTELAESFLQTIITCAANGEAHFSMKSLELVLVCVGHHDYEVAEITFNLWYRLSEELYQYDCESLTAMFRPHIERLIAALVRHCQCEPDLMQLPTEGDDFYDFRTKVMELIKDVVFIVGSTYVFKQMFTTLQQHTDASWEQTEAALFLMQAVAKNILPDEYEYVPKVVEAILTMPEDTFWALRKTCILLLGELCEWVEQHPQCLPACLHCLLRALDHAALATAAAAALQSICSAAPRACAANAGALVRAGAAREAHALPAPAATALLRAVAATISSLPPEEMAAALGEVAAAQLNELRSDAAASEAAARLDRLAALLRDLSPPRSALPALLPTVAGLWPAVADAMERQWADTKVQERACRVLRFAVRALGVEARPLLPQLAERLAGLYARKPHSCLLYLASILVDELARVEECVVPLMRLLGELMPRAFALLQEPDGLRDNPDTVDDLFRLCLRFLQRIPTEFLSSPALEQALRGAAQGLALDHREAHTSVCRFLVDLARRASAENTQDEAKARVKQLAQQALAQHGQHLTTAAITASALHIRSYMVGDVVDVLLELFHAAPASASDWLRNALASLPTEGAHATQAQCQQFHTLALQADKSKTLTRLLRDFSKLYR